MRALAAAFMGLLVLGVAGCGGTDYVAVDAPTGLLVVQQVQVGDHFYIEGSKAYVTAEPEEGGEAQELELPQTMKPTGSLKLAPGAYTLRSWQRPCEGN